MRHLLIASVIALSATIAHAAPPLFTPNGPADDRNDTIANVNRGPQYTVIHQSTVPVNGVNGLRIQGDTVFMNGKAISAPLVIQNYHLQLQPG